MLFFGRFPFTGVSIPDLLQSIVKADYTFPFQISESATDLLHHLITLDPGDRYTASEIMKTKYYKYSKQGQINIGIIRGIVLAVVIINISVYFKRLKKAKEKIVEEYKYQTKEFDSFAGILALKDIDEDPFAVDFKEQKFVTPL